MSISIYKKNGCKPVCLPHSKPSESALYTIKREHSIPHDFFLPKRPIVTVNRCDPFLPLIVKGVNLDVN